MTQPAALTPLYTVWVHLAPTDEDPTWSVYVNPETGVPAQHLPWPAAYQQGLKAWQSGAFFGVQITNEGA